MMEVICEGGKREEKEKFFLTGPRVLNYLKQIHYPIYDKNRNIGLFSYLLITNKSLIEITAIGLQECKLFS